MQLSKSLLVFAIVLMTVGTAHAKDGGSAEWKPFRFRVLGNFGPWVSSFKQSDSNGHQASVSSLISAGFQGQIGADLKYVFVEYNPVFLLANDTFHLTSQNDLNHQASGRDATYFSLFGVNVGMSNPYIAIEPYLGLELGNYHFKGGSKNEYGGETLKIGMNYFFNNYVGIKAEWRKVFLLTDGAGTIPSGISTSANVWFVGIAAGRR